MIAPRLPSEFLRYLVGNGYQPGDRLPPLNELSKEIGVSIGKLREQLDVARALGLVKASPRRGVTFTGYSFHPPTQLSLMVALAMIALCIVPIFEFFRKMSEVPSISEDILILIFLCRMLFDCCFFELKYRST